MYRQSRTVYILVLLTMIFVSVFVWLSGKQPVARAVDECTLSFSGSGSFIATSNGDGSYDITEVYGGGTFGPPGIVNGTIEIVYNANPTIASNVQINNNEVSLASPNVPNYPGQPSTFTVFVKGVGWQLPDPENPGEYLNCSDGGLDRPIDMILGDSGACVVWMPAANPDSVTGPGDTSQVSLLGNADIVGTIAADDGGYVNQNGFAGTFVADQSILNLSDGLASVNAYGFKKTGSLDQVGCPIQRVDISYLPDYECPGGVVQLDDDTITIGETVTAIAPMGWTGGQFNSNGLLDFGPVSGNQATGTGATIGSGDVTGFGWSAPNGATNCNLTGSNITVTSNAPTVDLKANNQDSISVPYNTNVSLSWTSANVSSCTLSPGGATGTSNPNLPTGNLTASITYTIDCTGPTGAAQDSVTITVGAPPGEPDVACSPGTQTVETGVQAAFIASPTGGSGGVVLWSAPNGTPATGNGNSFSTVYNNIGNYNVTVSYEGVSRTCTVSVTAPVTDNPPEGDFTLANCTSLTGYAYDTNVPNEPLTVKLYETTASTEQVVANAIASSSLPGNPPTDAINGAAGFWNSGGFPTQWLELNLGSTKSVQRLRLEVARSPDGNSIHKIYAGSTSNPGTLVHTFDQNTINGQWLDVTFSPILENIQYIRIVTENGTNVLFDHGLETPAQGDGNFTYAGNIAGSSWIFSGASGLAGNYSAFTNGNATAPQGSQVGFLQVAGSQISKNVLGLQSTATYIVKFKASKRAGYNTQDFDVYIGNTYLGTYTPTLNTYQEYTTASFTGLSGTQLLRFTGNNTGGGDSTAFIDDIQFYQIDASWTAWSDTEVFSPGGMTLLKTATANQTSSNLPVPGNHNFLIPTPNSVKDGSQHSLAIYALNDAGSPAEVQLSNSPRNITCVPVSNLITAANKDVIGVRDTTINDWAWNDYQSTANVGALQPINSGDEIKFAITVWNTGNADFTGQLVVEDIMTNLAKPDSGSWSEKYFCNYTDVNNPSAPANTCNSKFQNIADPTYDGNKLTFTLQTRPGEAIRPDDTIIITFKAKTKPPAGSSSTVFRFINRAEINNETGLALQTPAVIFFKDLASPSLLER